MPDEENLEFEDLENKADREVQRNQTLSKKVAETAKERDEARQAQEKAEAERVSALKEVEFYKDFSTQTSKYTGATEYQDAIKEKVMSGYTVEDATVAVLAKEGKLPNMQPAPVEPPIGSPAGGSATTTMTAPGEKSIGEMTRDEKRAQLVELESRGDISLS